MKKLLLLFILIFAAGLLVFRGEKDTAVAETPAKSQSTDIKKAEELMRVGQKEMPSGICWLAIMAK